MLRTVPRMTALVLILAVTFGLEAVLANKTAPRSEKGIWKRDLPAITIKPLVTNATSVVLGLADQNSVQRDRRKAVGFKNRRLYRKSSSSSSSGSASGSVSASSEEKYESMKYGPKDYYDPSTGYDYGPKLRKRPPPSPGRRAKPQQHHLRLDEYDEGNGYYELY